MPFAPSIQSVLSSLSLSCSLALSRSASRLPVGAACASLCGEESSRADIQSSVSRYTSFSAACLPRVETHSFGPFCYSSCSGFSQECACACVRKALSYWTTDERAWKREGRTGWMYLHGRRLIKGLMVRTPFQPCGCGDVMASRGAGEVLLPLRCFLSFHSAVLGSECPEVER